MLVTRMLDCFIPKFRTFVTEMIKNLCGPDQNFVQLTQEAVGQARLKDNVETWDLGQLVTIFSSAQLQESVFKKCFDEKQFKSVIAYLMQIKDIRNRRAHEISETLPITARQAYNVADCMCRVFEAMTI